MAGADTSIGVFTLDRELRVLSWDAWMAQSTGKPADAVRGRALFDLYPELASGQKGERLRGVVDQGAVEVFSPVFHRYLIPCPPRFPARRFDRMQQSATAAPLRDDSGAIIGCLVRIEDVTARREVEVEAADDLRSGDEPTRLRAAKKLAEVSAGEPLITALRDDSYRVRQAAVAGLARSGGREAVEALLRALHDEHRQPGVLNSALQVLEMLDVDVTTPLTDFLREEDKDLRIYAAHALGFQKNPAAVDALIAALDDGDANVRFHAIESLGRMRAAAATDKLAALASCGDFFIAFPAVEALAQIGDPSAGAKIAPLLEDRMLRLPVTRLLGRLGDPAAAARLTHLLDDPASWPEAAAAIAAIEARYQSLYQGGEHISALVRNTITAAAVNRLLDALKDRRRPELTAIVRILSWIDDPRVDAALVRLFNESTVRREVIDALVSRGRKVTDLIVGQVDGDDLETRRAAVMALGRIADADAVPALVRALEDPDLAILAAGALSKIGDARAFEPLLALIGHPDASLRQAAIGALNSLGHPELPRRAKELMRSEDPRLRESAARICGYFGYVDSLEAMLELVNDPNDRVARAAVESLAFYSEEKTVLSALHASIRSPRPAIRAAAARALAQIDDPVVAGWLTGALKDDDAWVRYYAARALGQLGSTEAIEPLAGVARADAASQVQAAALEALGNIGGSRVAAILSPFAESGSPDLARTAIQALGKIAHPDVLPPLMAALASDQPARRMDALVALGRRGGADSVSELRRVAETDTSTDVARAAIEALATIGEPAAVQALIELSASPGLRDGCLDALVRHCADKLHWISKGLLSAEARVRLGVVDALRRIHNQSACDHLARALDDRETAVRLAAVTALAELGHRGADRRLAEVARTDPEATVRRAALSALEAGTR